MINLLMSKYNLTEDACQEYFTFIKDCKQPNKTEYFEKHHILPVSLFPELKRNKNNIVNLYPRDHFLAHYHLAKITKTKEMIFAFNQMRRVLKKFSDVIEDVHELSLLYEEFRERLAELLSSTNTGRIVSDANKKQVSERFKGMVPVRYPDGSTGIVSNKDPDYINGILIPVQTGSKRSEEGIKNLREANSAKNKGYPYYNTTTKERRYFKRGEEPEGWVAGIPYSPEGKPGASWYHNKITGERGRFYENEIPEGWVKGKAQTAENHFSKPAYKNPMSGITEFITKGEDIPKFFHNQAAKYYYVWKINSDIFFTPRKLTAPKDFMYRIDISKVDFDTTELHNFIWIY